MEIKTGKGEIAASFLHTVLLFAGLYYPFGIWICALDEKGALRFCLCSAVLLIPAVASWFAIRHTKTLWQFLLVGIGVAVVMGTVGEAAGMLFTSAAASYGESSLEQKAWQSPGNLSMALAVLSTCFIFAVRGYVRIKKGRMIKEFREMPSGSVPPENMEAWEIPTLFDLPQPVHWIWFVILYVMGMALKYELFWRLAFYLLLTDIFLCFYCQFMGRMRDFIVEHQRIANLPVETMVKVGKTILAIAVLILVFFALPSILYGKDPIADAIAGYEPKPVERQETVNDISAVEPAPEMDFAEAMAGLGEAKELPAWVQSIGKVIVYLILAGGAVLLLRAIYQACRSAGSSFAEKDGDEILFLEKEGTEERVRLGRKKREGEGMFSPNMQIRRRYKKRIKKTLKTTLRGSETPHELEEKAEVEQSETMQTLHHYYEKARYSQEGCTKEEAEQTRQ
ncbi:MAG: hypothetical protein ACI4EG_00540 [Fusicatenibacter sp.]